MKKGLLTLLIVLLTMVSTTAYSQKSKEYCSEVTNASRKLQKKVKKKFIKRAVKNYPMALAEIEKAKKDYPTQEFGYDKLVEEVPSWITMNKVLDRFDGNKIVDKKGNTFEFTTTDYQSLLDESKIKAGEAHFAAAKKIIEEETEFAEIEKAFPHFDKTNYYVKNHKDEISEIKTELYYKEGARIINSSTLFSERVKSIKYFDKALKVTKPYKDIDELCANMYYEEGVNLSSGETTKELSNAISYFQKSQKYIAEYKDANEKIEEARNAGAELVYQEAIELEFEESFKGQAIAAKKFKEVEKWVVDYKDAKEKAIAADGSSYVTALVIDANGKVFQGDPVMRMSERTKKSIIFSKGYDDLSALDLNDESNYPQATELTKKYFIYVKFGEKSDGEFDEGGPTEKVVDKMVYAYQEKGKEEKIVSKDKYDQLKKIDDLSGNVSGYKFRTYSGKVKSTKEWVSYKAVYNIDIWDARIPDSPILLGTIACDKRFYDSRITETYTGNNKAKPSHLKNDTHELLKEAQLLEKMKAQDVSIGGLLNAKNSRGYVNYTYVTQMLDKEIEYVPLNQ